MDIHPVKGAAPVDTTGAAIVATPINMANFKRVLFIVQLGVLTNITTIIASLHQGAVVETVATALAIKRAWYSATGGDTWAAATIETDGTVNIADGTDGGLFMFDVRAADLDVDGGKQVVELNLSSPGAHACLVAVLALCLEPRFQKGTPPSAIIN